MLKICHQLSLRICICITLTNGYPSVNLFRVIERYICSSRRVIQIVFLFETLNYEKGFETMNCTTAIPRDNYFSHCVKLSQISKVKMMINLNHCNLENSTKYFVFRKIEYEREKLIFIMEYKFNIFFIRV